MLFFNEEADIWIGKRTLKELKENKDLDWFSKGYKDYKPDTSVIKQIKSLKSFNDIKIVVVGGSWCDDTRYLLPKFCRMFDMCKLDESKLEFYFVDREKNDPDNTKKKFDIFKIPTFIIYKKNYEAGRVIESTQKNIESDILDILKITE